MPVRVKSSGSVPETATGSTTEGEDEEDEIVKEIDVFLSPELSEQLHLMQYPLQQRSFSTPIDARVKPRHCMIELDYQTPAGTGDYGSYQMSARSYASHTIPVSTHMALGKLVDEPGLEGLHLVPLSRITQMRPSFSHVDEETGMMDTSKEDTVKREAETPTLERKPITLQKKESERAALARKSTYAYKKVSEESEPWSSLRIYDKDSMEADEVMERVICPSVKEKLISGIDDTNNGSSERPLNEQYVKTLNYLPASSIGQEKQSLDEEDTLQGHCTKLVGLMQEGWPIPFSVLRDRFPESVTNETLFEALGSCAFLVRGNFVLNSKLLPISPSIAFARTFILFLFQTIEVIHRSRLEHVYDGDEEVTPEVILMLLRQVGTKTTNGWRLKVEDDPTFAEKYKATLLIHLNFWSKQLRRFQPLLNRYQEDPN